MNQRGTELPPHSPVNSIQGSAGLDDEQLIKKIAEGDKTAFTEFTTRHINKIMQFAIRYMKNRDDAEDITQEAFTRLWTKAPQWQAKGIAPHSWLYRVTYNLCIDALRKQRTNIIIDGEVYPFTPSADNPLQQELQQQVVERAIAALPERQQAAIILCAYQGLSNREAATAMDISVDALESLLSRARRKLREHLIQKEGIGS